VPLRVVTAATAITGLPNEKIILHNQYLGGNFRRRLETDCVEAGDQDRQEGAVSGQAGADPGARYPARHSTPCLHEHIGNPTIADAALDRLVHTAHRIELKGESLRNLRAAKALKA
jgi:hypothetical protein